MEDVEGGSKKSNIASDIVEAGSRRAFKAMSRDGIADLLDGVVGYGELIAICVEQLAIGVSFELLGV